jgi:hypothetical protein
VPRVAATRQIDCDLGSNLFESEILFMMAVPPELFLRCRDVVTHVGIRLKYLLTIQIPKFQTLSQFGAILTEQINLNTLPGWQPALPGPQACCNGHMLGAKAQQHGCIYLAASEASVTNGCCSAGWVRKRKSLLSKERQLVHSPITASLITAIRWTVNIKWHVFFKMWSGRGRDTEVHMNSFLR